MRAALERAKNAIHRRASNPLRVVPSGGDPSLTSASSRGHHRHQKRGSEKEAAAGVSSLDGRDLPTSNAVTTTGTPGETASLNAKDNQMEFIQHYYRVIRSFIEDKSKYELELPSLSGHDRLIVHALAERCNLSHESTGSHAERALHLKKDLLFFQNPDAVSKVKLEEVVEKLSGKESKYHVRFIRATPPAQVATGEVGSYADEEALEKIERLRRATDEYRHATDMGYTQQELLLAEAGDLNGNDEGEDGDTITDTSADERRFLGMQGRIEEILSRPDPSIAAIAGPSSDFAPSSRTPTAVVGAVSTTKESKAKPTTTYDEVCRSCGVHHRLDGALSGWSCSHHCSSCGRQTIWSLEEAREVASNTAAAVPAAGRRKRGRDCTTGDENAENVDGSEEDAARRSGARHKEEPSSETELDETEELTVEDVMEMAATNDFKSKDLNWLRVFCTASNSHQLTSAENKTDSLRCKSLLQRIAFCIDFADLTEMSIFKQYDATLRLSTSSRHPNCSGYVVVREIPELSRTVSDILTEMINDAFSPVEAAPSSAASSPPVEPIQTAETEQQAMEHMAIAFPNVSVYGSACTAICQLRPVVRGAAVPEMVISEASLAGLQRRYGDKAFYVVRDLNEAIEHASRDAMQ